MREALKSLAHAVRAATPMSLRRGVSRVGRFFEPPKGPQFPSMEGALGYLRDWGFRPSHAVDVGAYHGQWAAMFRGVFPDCRVLMIEGQEKKAAELKALCAASGGKLAFEPALLGAKDGEKVRFVEMETGSSVYEETSPYKREYTEKELTTLDAIARRLPEFASPGFLKLDVQGYELEVLRGAAELLAKTEFVLLEASLIPVNKGCPLIDEVIAFLSARGFRLLDFCSQTRRTDNALWQTDLLFIRNDSPLLPKARIDPTNWCASSKRSATGWPPCGTASATARIAAITTPPATGPTVMRASASTLEAWATRGSPPTRTCGCIRRPRPSSWRFAAPRASISKPRACSRSAAARAFTPRSFASRADEATSASTSPTRSCRACARSSPASSSESWTSAPRSSRGATTSSR